MKKIILLLFIFQISCVENISQQTLQQSVKRVVIDAVFSDLVDFNRVIITQSTQFDTQNKIEKVENGLVIIKNTTQNISDTLLHTKDGIYKSNKTNFVPKSNQIYELIVEVNGQKYTSKTKCPAKVGFELIDLRSKFKEIARPFANYAQFNFSENRYIYSGDSLFEVEANGRINRSENNYLRGEVYRFDDKYKNPNIFLIFDTQRVVNEVNNINPPGAFLRNDEVSIYIFGITPESYKFYQTLRQLTNYEGGLFSPSQGNPISNLDNGALGLFDVCLIKKFKIFVK